jgi:hypothetical protein
MVSLPTEHLSEYLQHSLETSPLNRYHRLRLVIGSPTLDLPITNHKTELSFTSALKYGSTYLKRPTSCCWRSTVLLPRPHLSNGECS